MKCIRYTAGCISRAKCKLIEQMRLKLFFEYNRICLLLTLINIIAVFFIIRGSELPILYNSKILDFLFCVEKNSDKTLYNIGISYLAAYVFYIIQVYYPERKKTKNALLNMKMPAYNLVLWIDRFLYVWELYVIENPEKLGTVKEVNIQTVYLKTDDGFVYRVDRERFENMIGRIEKAYEAIISAQSFYACDYSLRLLLLGDNMLNEVKKIFKIAIKSEIFNKNPDISMGFPKRTVVQLRAKSLLLIKLLKLDVDVNISLTTDEKDIETAEQKTGRLQETMRKNVEQIEKAKALL